MFLNRLKNKEKIRFLELKENMIVTYCIMYLDNFLKSEKNKNKSRKNL